MDHAKETQLASVAWDATKREDQPGFAALSAAYKPTLFAKVQSVVLHGPAEGDAFEQEVARLLSQPAEGGSGDAPLPNTPYPEGDSTTETVSLSNNTVTAPVEESPVEESAKRKRR